MANPIEFKTKLNYPRLMTLSFQLDPVYSIVNLLTKLIGVILAPYSVILTARFVDIAVAIFNGTAEAGSIVLPIVMLTFIKFYSTLVNIITSPVTLGHNGKRWERLEYPLMQRVASLDLKDLEDSELQNEFGGFMNGQLYEIMEFPEVIKNMIFSAIQMVSYLIVLYGYVPWIILPICILVIPTVILSRSKENFSFEHRKNQMLNGRYNGQYYGFLMGREAACERGMFGYTDMVTELYKKTTTEVTNRIFKGNLQFGIKGNLFKILSCILCFIAVFLMAPTLISGSITIGIFISVVSTILTIIPKINADFSMYYTFVLAFAHRQVKLFNKFLKLTANSEHTAPMSEKVPEFRFLELKNVTFTYPGTDKKILNGVSMKIEAGRKYSLVGVNGSGKSTLIKLILRLYDDYGGEILLNGKDLRSWNEGDIKAMFSAVMQNFVKYEISLEDNIKVGSGFRADDSEVDRALDLIGLDGAVSSLADGKKTMLGKLHENGADLSGGQWQRIAMARSIVHNSGLKILDEPTSALDPIAECEFYRKFDEIVRGGTVIFISHRLASAKDSDCIFVLNNGKITEKGRHAELMEQHGLYAEMFESQREWYL